MLASFMQRPALCLCAAAWLLSSVAVAAPGGAKKKKPNDQRPGNEKEALRREEARRANARFLRVIRAERPVRLSVWRPADAIQYIPSGEYLTLEELVQRENRRQLQSEHLLTNTIEVRTGVHEAR